MVPAQCLYYIIIVASVRLFLLKFFTYLNSQRRQIFDRKSFSTFSLFFNDKFDLFISKILYIMQDNNSRLNLFHEFDTKTSVFSCILFKTNLFNHSVPYELLTRHPQRSIRRRITIRYEVIAYVGYISVISRFAGSADGRGAIITMCNIQTNYM